MCELVIEKEAKDAEVAWKIAVWLGRRIGVRTCSVLVFSICYSLSYSIVLCDKCLLWHAIKIAGHVQARRYHHPGPKQVPSLLCKHRSSNRRQSTHL